MLETTALLLSLSCAQQAPPASWPPELPPPLATPLVETDEQHDGRMAWWRQARFGLFIHWGLYSIPAGTWNEKRTGGAEWILNVAKIHPDEYMPLQDQFNPVDFDATQWAMIAKNAGMRYIVITSKHHDGFCLWPSEQTDFDIAGSPFGRDILGELAEACAREGIVLCFYHSIMDWTHPDYLPRRPWDDRPTETADYEAYISYMQRQIDELISGYQPAVLWFDGEWEGSWKHEHGQALYDHIREQAPWVIVNNRVDTGRTGMAGLTRDGGYRGDFGTPEQQIPATGFPPGVDWETCMTMNRSWGWQSFDDAWKSTEDLVRKLVDIASKGGNFLLNVGPMGNGMFPPEAIERLAAIGTWMDVNAESVRGTFASCFGPLEWGRCTRRSLPDGNQRLYLHVFERPESGQLWLDGLMNEPLDGGAYLLADPGAGALKVRREDASLAISLPATLENPMDTVIVLDIAGEAVVIGSPSIEPGNGTIFIDSLDCTMRSPSERVDIRYTLDGSVPTETSSRFAGPVRVKQTSVVTARCFLESTPVSPLAMIRYEKVTPHKSVHPLIKRNGLDQAVYLGEFDAVPDFNALQPVSQAVVQQIDLAHEPRDENFAMRFTGFIDVPNTTVYTFALDSDDGSRLWIAETLVVDNDGLHSARRLEGDIALEAGLHPIIIEFFEKTGQQDLAVDWSRPGAGFTTIPADVLFH